MYLWPILEGNTLQRCCLNALNATKLLSSRNNHCTGDSSTSRIFGQKKWLVEAKQHGDFNLVGTSQLRHHLMISLWGKRVVQVWVRSLQLPQTTGTLVTGLAPVTVVPVTDKLVTIITFLDRHKLKLSLLPQQHCHGFNARWESSTC